jgi:hypothetical protein
MSITTARQALGTALAGAGRVVYDAPRENMTPPCLMLIPAEPYIEIASIGATPKYIASFRLTFCVAYQDNQAALANLENLIEVGIAALPSGVTIGTIGRPATMAVGANQLLVADATVTIRI